MPRTKTVDSTGRTDLTKLCFYCGKDVSMKGDTVVYKDKLVCAKCDLIVNPAKPEAQEHE